MDIFSVLTGLSGLAFFLFGMTLLSSGLENIAGGRLERTLEKMTSNPFLGFLLGAAVTAAIQSSSAVTVMLIGFVNSSIMTLKQAISVVMGSNFGTTITAWILSVAGIEADNIVLKFLKPESISAVFAIIGIVMLIVAKSNRKKDIGTTLIGFAILLFGMGIMTDAVKPLAELEAFKNLLVMFKNPLLGIIVGALVTAVIQSSSASVGILQAVSVTGSLSIGSSIPIIMGQNIGTCITALISSIGTNKNAKRVAAVHFYFNFLGTVTIMLLLYVPNLFLNFSFLDDPVSPFMIAVLHTLFNIITTIILFPLRGLLEKLAVKTVKDKKDKGVSSVLDERLLLSPSFAITKCEDLTNQMATLSFDNINCSIKLLDNPDKKLIDKISKREKTVDEYEDILGSYLVKLSSSPLNEQDSKNITLLLHSIGDFERISDHAVNISEAAEKLQDKKLNFSKAALSDIKVLAQAVSEICKLANDCFVNHDTAIAAEVEPLEQAIDSLISQIKSKHVDRLQSGDCTIELGFIFSDLLTNFERVSDHCSNIAAYIIKSNSADFEVHRYLSSVKHSQNSYFTKRLENYINKYKLHGKDV